MFSRSTAAVALYSIAVVVFSKSFVVHSSSVATESPGGAAGAESNDQVDYSQIDLHTLTDDELVSICTDRGFELVTDVDDATGEPLSYSHEQYVDAAKECLQLEAEMEDFYNENPNLLEDLEAERDRMLKEHEELERQLKEAKEKLESEKAEAASKKGGSAFVRTEGTISEEGSEKASTAGDAETKGNEEDKSAPDATHSSGGNKDKPKPDREELLADDEVIDLDDIVDEVVEESKKGTAEQEAANEIPEGIDHSGAEEKASDASNQTAADAAGDSEVASTEKTGGPRTMVVEFKEVALEFREKVKSDFNRVADIVVPRPIRGLLKKGLKVGLKVAKDTALQAADMIKRYASALFEKGKTAYEKRQQEQQQQQEQEGNKQENDAAATAAA